MIDKGLMVNQLVGMDLFLMGLMVKVQTVMFLKVTVSTVRD